MSVIGLDVHRSFGQIAILEKGKIRDAGRVAMEREAVLRFARTLTASDEVVLEETGNTRHLGEAVHAFRPELSWPTRCSACDRLGEG